MGAKGRPGWGCQGSEEGGTWGWEVSMGEGKEKAPGGQSTDKVHIHWWVCKKGVGEGPWEKLFLPSSRERTELRTQGLR